LKEQTVFHVEGVEELILFNLDTNVWDGFDRRWVNLMGKQVDLSELLF